MGNRGLLAAASTRRVSARLLRSVIDQLDAGDVLMVTRLDRLARSTRDLLNTLAAIADRKAGFRSLAETWADTHHLARPADADRARRTCRVRLTPS
jgi:DNA invertase Pin-like site-specific DNA recombinase